MYYLDTNVIVDLIRGKIHRLQERFAEHTLNEINVPAIAVAELEFGAQHSGNYEAKMTEAMDVIRSFRVVPFGMKEAEVYGIIRQELSSKGYAIGPNDLLIAATALANDGILVTYNTREFSRIASLKIEDWTI